MKEIKPYENLANSIIVRACNDYRYDIITEEELKSFIYSKWFQVLTNTNPDSLFKLITKEKRMNNGTKKGKKKN